MSFSSTSSGQMVDMNVTPLVDVMLVLLIIFMVTVPTISFPIQVDLPQATPPRVQSPFRQSRSTCASMPVARSTGMEAP